MKQQVKFEDWGNIGYQTAWDRQEILMKENLDIKTENRLGETIENYTQQKTKNHFILCEHPHVYTLGKSGAMENLLLSNQKLQEYGVEFFKTNRGGDITYHGPDQIVGYPILDLEIFFTDIGKYMRFLEEVIIQTLAYYGIHGDRLAGATGVWLDKDDPSKARKICAMGVKSSRWITMHGFALNVNTDLSFFGHIVPCGITDKGVTSMEKELGEKINIEEVKILLRKNFEKVFDCNLV